MPTMTITTTAPQAARLAEALGRLLGLKDANGAPRDATAAAVAGITDTAFDPS